MNKKYVIDGEPRLYKRLLKDRVWTTEQQEHLSAAIALSEQLNYHEPLDGKCEINIKFYTNNLRTPIEKLIKFVLNISNGLIYKESCNVMHINAKKIKHPSPRTEIILKIKE